MADPIFFGAVGWADILPDHEALWSSRLHIHKGFDQYANLRPALLTPHMFCPLAGRKPCDIDRVIVRENSEDNIVRSAGGCSAKSTGKSSSNASRYPRRAPVRVNNRIANLHPAMHPRRRVAAK